MSDRSWWGRRAAGTTDQMAGVLAADERASRNLDERLRRMNERASALDGRLRRHAGESASWHRKWGGPLPN